MLDDTRDALIRTLERFTPADDVEAGHVRRVLHLLRMVPRPFARTTAVGHVTASAFVVDPSGQDTLLVWHRKLGRWLQPGGHCEPDADADTAAAAARELHEETGLTARDHCEPGVGLFDVDIHPIPAHGAEPAHEHFDLRYLFRVRAGCETLPNLSGRWFPLTDPVVQGEASLVRMAAKVLTGP
jgi:8-oxo-dGTP pyrophosphatase MutT (NUDIX family)